MGFVVLFVDHYCTRDLLCEHATDDSDERRGVIMRDVITISIIISMNYMLHSVSS
jgi:hypothetical protein